jgi:hypothetical protein
VGRSLVAIICTVLATASACTSSTSGTGARLHSSQASGAASPATLNAQLLTPDDLPAGWKVADTADPAMLPAPPCVEAAVNALETPTRARVQLVKSDSLPLLEQQLGRYASAVEATAKYDTAVAAVDSCQKFTFDYQGVTATGSIGRLAFHSLGDHSTAWHLTVNAMGLLATGDALLVAKGSELQLLVYLNLGNTDPRDFAPLTLAALAKMSG